MKKIQTAIHTVVEEYISNAEDTEMDENNIEGYKKLNEKCDVVISKIKNRKNTKKTKKATV